MSETFESLGIVPWIVRQTAKLGNNQFKQNCRPLDLQKLSFLGLKKPTPIQRNCIPQILAGADCIGAAKTG